MRKIWALTLALALGAAAGASAFYSGPDDPQSEALKQKFSQQEQIILGAILTDPGLADSFAADAKAGASQATMVKWRAHMAAFAQNYLDKEHPINLNARSIEDMVEPAEIGALETSMQMLAKGGLMDTAKYNIFKGRIRDAETQLQSGQGNSKALEVINTARPMLVSGLKEFIASPEGQAGLVESRRISELAAREKAAREQAERIASEQERARNAKTPEDAANRAGQSYNREPNRTGDSSAVVVEGWDQSRLSPAAQLGRPAGDPQGRTDLAVSPPPAPQKKKGGLLSSLDALDQGASGHKACMATGGGALLGLLAALFVFALPPLGVLAVTAAAGAAGYFVAKKLWG